VREGKGKGYLNSEGGKVRVFSIVREGKGYLLIVKGLFESFI
jgi:hypothetical protein